MKSETSKAISTHQLIFMKCTELKIHKNRNYSIRHLSSLLIVPARTLHSVIEAIDELKE